MGIITAHECRREAAELRAELRDLDTWESFDVKGIAKHGYNEIDTIPSTPSMNLRPRMPRTKPPKPVKDPISKTRKARGRALTTVPNLAVYAPISDKKMAKLTRKMLFIRDIGVGSQNRFKGNITINHEEGRFDDTVRIQSIKDRYSSEQYLAYWTDGSLNQGVLGAAVVWRGAGQQWHTRGFAVGKDIGHSQSAEIYGVAQALKIAADQSQTQRSVKLVTIFTDSASLLSALKSGSPCDLGPMISGQFALQVIHERTNWLESKGIRVDLIWVKGHASSEGNNKADRIATQTVGLQKDLNAVDHDESAGHGVYTLIRKAKPMPKKNSRRKNVQHRKLRIQKLASADTTPKTTNFEKTTENLISSITTREDGIKTVRHKLEQHRRPPSRTYVYEQAELAKTRSGPQEVTDIRKVRQDRARDERRRKRNAGAISELTNRPESIGLAMSHEPRVATPSFIKPVDNKFARSCAARQANEPQFRGKDSSLRLRDVTVEIENSRKDINQPASDSILYAGFMELQHLPKEVSELTQALETISKAPEPLSTVQDDSTGISAQAPKRPYPPTAQKHNNPLGENGVIDLTIDNDGDIELTDCPTTVKSNETEMKEGIDFGWESKDEQRPKRPARKSFDARIVIEISDDETNDHNKSVCKSKLMGQHLQEWQSQERQSQEWQTYQNLIDLTTANTRQTSIASSYSAFSQSPNPNDGNQHRNTFTYREL